MEYTIEKLVEEFPVNTEIEVIEMEPGINTDIADIGKVGEKGKVLVYFVNEKQLFCSFPSGKKTVSPQYVKKV